MAKAIAAAIGVGAFVACSAASALDLHLYWENRCQECHGHAGAFARRHLKVVQGVLAGSHHKSDLKRFLGQHEAGPSLASDIYEMLLAQVQTKPVFQQKCAGCHDTAAAFARSSLTIRDSVVVGRSNGIPIAEFLKGTGSSLPRSPPPSLRALRELSKRSALH